MQSSASFASWVGFIFYSYNGEFIFMNGKQAKRMRNSVTGEETSYTKTYTNKTKIYKDEDIGEMLQYGHTAKLSKNSHRYKYKQLKKGYK